MSNTKIVIDKEQVLDFHEEIEVHGLQSAINKYATEIQIDKSIEERAKAKYPVDIYENVKQQKLVDAFTKAKRDYFIEGATQQQIIEQLKVKEKERIGAIKFGRWILKHTIAPNHNIDGSCWKFENNNELIDTAELVDLSINDPYLINKFNPNI